jgi:hypothetical protein
MIIEARIDESRIEMIAVSEKRIDISILINEASIFSPTNVRTNASPIFRYRK